MVFVVHLLKLTGFSMELCEETVDGDGRSFNCHLSMVWECMCVLRPIIDESTSFTRIENREKRGNWSASETTAARVESAQHLLTAPNR